MTCVLSPVRKLPELSGQADVYGITAAAALGSGERSATPEKGSSQEPSELGGPTWAGLAGVGAEAGEDPPVLEVADAVPGGGAGGGQRLVGVLLGGVSLRVRVNVRPRASL